MKIISKNLLSNSTIRQKPIGSKRNQNLICSDGFQIIKYLEQNSASRQVGIATMLETTRFRRILQVDIELVQLHRYKYLFQFQLLKTVTFNYY